MSTGTFDYRDEAGRVAVGPAIAFVARMRNLAVTAPHGQVLDRLEGHAVDAGRESLRGTLGRAVQADVDDAEGKKGRIVRAGAVGVARDGPSGGWHTLDVVLASRDRQGVASWEGEAPAE